MVNRLERQSAKVGFYCAVYSIYPKDTLIVKKNYKINKTRLIQRSDY